MPMFWNTAIAIFIGVLSGVITSLILQNTPVPVKWSEKVETISGDDRDGAVYRAVLTRRTWSRGFKGPVDLQLHASMSVRINDRLERNIPIPLDREWRPGVKTVIGVLLSPQQCRAEDLAKLPDNIREIHRQGNLTLDDLFAAGRVSVDPDKHSELRLYVYGMRRRTGTRWFCIHAYALDDIEQSRGRSTSETA